MTATVYSLLDFGHGKRVEQWGAYKLVRPDPTAVGMPAHPDLWLKPDAVYQGEKGEGEWKKTTPLPEHWEVMFDDIKLCVRLAPYKHTGVFPEQQQNWNWMRNEAKKKKRPLAILNVFAYTGGASVALAKDGHSVTHVDASRPAIGWAKENAALNELTNIRWILEDASLFAAKELKRGKKYDGIILDPPAFGHSPTGKTWRVERDLAPLLETCAQLLSDDPAFLVLNGYAHADTPDSFRRLLTGVIRSKTKIPHIAIDCQELNLKTMSGEILSTGITARCSF